jgi:hypothetical protein
VALITRQAHPTAARFSSDLTAASVRGLHMVKLC